MVEVTERQKAEFIKGVVQMQGTQFGTRGFLEAALIADAVIKDCERIIEAEKSKEAGSEP